MIFNEKCGPSNTQQNSIKIKQTEKCTARINSQYFANSLYFQHKLSKLSGHSTPQYCISASFDHLSDFDIMNNINSKTD